MSDAYDFKPGGSLKFKGEKSKKKKKGSSSDDRALVQARLDQAAKEAEIEAAAQREKERAKSGTPEAAGSGAESSEFQGGTGPGRKKTAAEEKWERIQEERRRERARKAARLTHKERVDAFNAALDRLSEHHDMPRIGPG